MSESPAIQKHVYPLRMENPNKRRPNTSTAARSSTSKKDIMNNLVRRPITAKKRATQMFKAKNEIERWAYGNDDVDEIGYESDEIKSIDDDYIDEIVNKDYDEIILDQMLLNKKRDTIGNILKEVRNHKKSVAEKSKKDPNFIASELKSYALNELIVKQKSEKDDNTLERLQRLSSIGHNPFGAGIFDFNPKDIDELERPSRPSSVKKEDIAAAMKFKASKNGLSRAVPGKLQQNITLERNFFKDLLKLSRQRYLVKVGTDFQMRKFTDKQSKKGLCDVPGTERSRYSNVSRTKSSNTHKGSAYRRSNMKYYGDDETTTNDTTDDFNNYSIKKRSMSAFVKRKSSTPVSRPVTRNEKKPPLYPEDSNKDYVEVKTDNDENLEEELIKFSFKNPGSQSNMSHVSFKSASSTIKNANSKKPKSSSQMTNYSTKDDESDYQSKEHKMRCASAVERRSNQDMPNASPKAQDRQSSDTDYQVVDRKLRCASAYEKRSTQTASKASEEKPSEVASTHDAISIVNEANDPKLSETIQDHRSNHITATIRRTQSLKRPNTSIAVQRINFAQEALKNSPKKESTKPQNISLDINQNPVVDTRYTSLLGTMGSVYVPKTGFTTIRTKEAVDERVRNLINNNEALRSYDGVEKERKTRFELDKNMKLFERLVTNYF